MYWGDNMNIDTSNLLNSILEELSSLSYVHPGDVPNINLYMDQVTTFMDEQLASTKRYPDDKIPFINQKIQPVKDPEKVFRRLYLVLNRIVYFPFFFSSFFEDLEERSSMIRSMIIFLIYTSKLKLHINANCCKISLSSPSARWVKVSADFS